jgi:hypothetical protein
MDFLLSPYYPSSCPLLLYRSSNVERLSNVIAHRWKILPESGRDLYRRVARADASKYEAYNGHWYQTEQEGTSCLVAALVLSTSISHSDSPLPVV